MIILIRANDTFFFYLVNALDRTKVCSQLI